MKNRFDPGRPYRLRNTIQHYDWGSRTAMTELLGIENPESEPQAELWMGAHPKAPSFLLPADSAAAPAAGGSGAPMSLLEAIGEAGDALLGRGMSARFGSALPFLFKVLSAGKPLSIQAHPNKKQAEEGYARENNAGIPIDSPQRNYRDANHKPEVLCALTSFVGLRGFRPIPEIIEELHAHGIEELAASAALLERNPDRRGLAAAFELLMVQPEPSQKELVARVVRSSAGREAQRYRWVARLQELFPGDIGVICPLLLNIVSLEAGQAMFLEAGVLHAYLEGTGIELMANSDNVLRGGLTSKHIDVPELLRVLTFANGPAQTLQPSAGADGALVYPTPISEFRLSRVELENRTPFVSSRERSAEILLCVEGSARLSWDGGATSIERGDSLLVPAALSAYRIEGAGRLFRADAPLGSAGRNERGLA